MSLDEAQYRRTWQKRVADERQPLAMARQAGSAADDLAWVFMAGYQAAIRAVFPGVDLPGWAAFAVSEDRSETSPLPGVSWQAHPRGMVLTGFKTWVAGVDHIDHLIVRARGASPLYLIMARAANGLTLTRHPTPAFLPALSQGQAELNEVVVTSEQQLDDKLVASFADCESLYIYVAFLAMLQSTLPAHAVHEALLSKVDAALQLAVSLDPLQGSLAQMAQLDDQVLHIRQQLTRDVYAGDERWARDEKLIAMYSRGVQRRVQETGET